MKIRTKVRAGGVSLPNHNETLMTGLKLNTRVKAGGLTRNHNQTLREEWRVRTIPASGEPTETVKAAPVGGLRVRTNVKAGGVKDHSV